jgi:hypothetical protein
MPYPSANARGQTTPGTALETQRLGIPGGVGNAHTIRGTANDLGMIGAPMDPYAYAYRQVAFNGSTQLSNATNLGLAANGSMTAAVAFRLTSLATLQTLIGQTSSAPLGLFNVNVDGSVTLNSPTNFSNAGVAGATIVPAGGIVPGNDYVLHVAIRSNPNLLQAWLNGQPQTVVGALLGTADMPAPTAWSIGGTPGGIQRMTGRLGLAWFDFGQLITDPAAFFPAKNLGTNLSNPTGRPAIGFGDTQQADAMAGNTAQGWNDGFNQGDGTGTWTLTGSVTDAT